MSLLLKIGNLFSKKPLGFVNSFLDGKKTYLGAVLIALPALACLVKMIIDKAPLDLNDLNAIIHSPCIKQMGEALAAAGLGHKLHKLNGSAV